jgi:hypothetical protein
MLAAFFHAALATLEGMAGGGGTGAGGSGSFSGAGGLAAGAAASGGGAHSAIHHRLITSAGLPRSVRAAAAQLLPSLFAPLLASLRRSVCGLGGSSLLLTHAPLLSSRISGLLADPTPGGLGGFSGTVYRPAGPARAQLYLTASCLLKACGSGVYARLVLPLLVQRQQGHLQQQQQSDHAGGASGLIRGELERMCVVPVQ